MADWVKMAVKAGLIVTATALIIVIFTQVTFPQIDISAFRNGIGVGRAIMNYWFPYMGTIFDIFLGLLLLELACYGIYIALIGIRWIFKVNE